VAIVGLGLIGASLGGALQRAGSLVRGFEAAPDRARTALERNLVDEVAPTLGAALVDAETIILAIPVLSIVDLLPEVDRLAPDDAMIMDTGSVKARVVEVMASLPGAQRCVGGHPLAGKADSGPAAADAAMFMGSPFVLTPSSRTGSATLARARSLVCAAGGVPIVLAAEAHDRAVARSSHLPQLAATALAITLEVGDTSLAGPGLRDMTRLAGSDPIMWRDIFLANRQNVARAAREYLERLERLTRLVEAGDSQGLESAMLQGRTAYSHIRVEGSA
jgi:prephenate dehydrogenase